MIGVLKKYKVKLNDEANLQVLLQELYNEACKNIEQVQTEMNKLINSVNLNEEAVDAKAKYAKAMNDYIANKDKAIGRKLDVAKLLAEIIKLSKSADDPFKDGEVIDDWSDLTENIANEDNAKQNNRKEYKIK